MSNERKAPPIIRPYQEGDRERVRKICVQTAPELFRQHEMMQALLFKAFCDYYIECEPQNCFMAVNEQNEAVGYILCAENAADWHKAFGEKYIAPVSDENARKFLESTCDACLTFGKDYPAHLHTDILPEYQRMGLGSLLMEALMHHLQEKQIPGLMLSVGNDNAGAQQFYERMGFVTLDKRPNEIVMGICL